MEGRLRGRGAVRFSEVDIRSLHYSFQFLCDGAVFLVSETQGGERSERLGAPKGSSYSRKEGEISKCMYVVRNA